MFNRHTPLEKEWKQLLKREKLLLAKMEKAKEPFWEKRLKTAVPDTLQKTLETAFFQSFKIIFSQGSGILEKTYSRERLEAEFKTLDYAQEIYQSRKNLSAVKRAAGQRSAKSVAGAAAEGAVLGILGIGLPDIAIFLSLLLRNLYMLELSYGIDYGDASEKELLLELVVLSLERGKKLREKDAGMNRRLYHLACAGHGTRAAAPYKPAKSPRMEIDGKEGTDAAMEMTAAEKMDQSVRRASEALAGELLYMKFLQGIPVVGMIGGLYDGIYMKKIMDYVSLKLERRYLLSKMSDKREPI